MTSVKSQTSDEGFKRLLELETEYRTQRLADQLHAIASYPHLFDEFPYPVLINSAILKIADYFRNSNNIQRCSILQVFKKSRHHLEKVVNVDEAIRRMSPMLQSNDPLARAITLRIIHSLDSSEAMEVSAAIYAADMIGAQSQRFCAIISGKLAFMVRDSKTPLPLRRRLIRIFGHMFEDITLARLARKTCLDILELNQDGEYTVAILRTLTRLASHSLVDVDQQIALLVQRAQDQSDSLPGIRRVALMCLGLLAQKSIEFRPEQIKAIYEIASESKDERTVLRAVATLNTIFRQTGAMTSIFLMDTGMDTIHNYIQATLQILDRSFLTFSSAPPSSTLASGSRLVVLECYTLLSLILSSYQPLDHTELLNEADETFKHAIKATTQSMEQFLIRIWSQDSEQLERKAQDGMTSNKDTQAKPVLWSLVSLTLKEGSAVDDLLKTLLGWMDTFKAKALLHIARQRPKKVQQLQDIILTFLENHVNSPHTETFILVYRALLEFSTLTHISATSSSKDAFESRVSLLLEQFGQVDMMEQYTRNHWELYKLARYSLQSGWSSLALVALRNQEKSLTSVSVALWVMVVQTVALIESSLQTAAVSASAGEENYGRLDLYSQQQMYIKVMGYLEELEVHQVNRTFHLKYCSLRRGYLQTCQSAAGILHLLSASLVAERQRQNIQGASSDMAIISTLASDEVALYRCADKFNRLAHQYTVLRDSIVVDQSSGLSGSMVTTTTTTEGALRSKGLKKSQYSDGAIEMLQTMCLIIAFTLQRVANILDRASSNTNAPNAEDQQQKTQGDDDVFDIDPLLMPLLYLCDQQQHEQDDMNGNSRISETFQDLFQSSTLMTLDYINKNVGGADLGALESGISIAQQLISRYITLPIPIPQEFFVSQQASRTV
ncbi:Integrator complex subunit 7 [Mortierella sp. NVP85]|nr:Integrator complex subunit 7 [Mortierella sp. NVP85]